MYLWRRLDLQPNAQDLGVEVGKVIYQSKFPQSKFVSEIDDLEFFFKIENKGSNPPVYLPSVRLKPNRPAKTLVYTGLRGGDRNSKKNDDDIGEIRYGIGRLSLSASGATASDNILTLSDDIHKLSDYGAEPGKVAQTIIVYHLMVKGQNNYYRITFLYFRVKGNANRKFAVIIEKY